MELCQIHSTMQSTFTYYVICNCDINFISVGSRNILNMSRGNENKIFILTLNLALEMLAYCVHPSIVKEDSILETQSSFLGLFVGHMILLIT